MTSARVVVMLLACASSSACYTLRAELPGTWRQSPPGTEDIRVVGKIDFETTHYFFLEGLVAQPSRNVFRDVLMDKVQAAHGDGVANVIVDARFMPLDVFIRGITLGILAPRTYRLRGDIVTIPGPPPPGKPLLSPSASVFPTTSVPGSLATPSAPSAPPSAPPRAPPTPPPLESDPFDPPPLLEGTP